MHVQLADSTLPYITVPTPSGGTVSVRADLFDGLSDVEFTRLMETVAHLNVPQSLSGIFDRTWEWIREQQRRRNDRKDRNLDARLDRKEGTRDSRDAKRYAQAAGVIPTQGQVWAGALPGIIGATGQAAGAIAPLFTGMPPFTGMPGAGGPVAGQFPRRPYPRQGGGNNTLLLVAGGLALMYILTKM